VKPRSLYGNVGQGLDYFSEGALPPNNSAAFGQYLCYLLNSKIKGFLKKKKSICCRQGLISWSNLCIHSEIVFAVVIH